MNRQHISSGSSFEAQIGYSRALVSGDWVFVSGTTGFDYATMTIADDLVEQTAQCLRNLEAALGQAGASLDDVVRVTYLLPQVDGFERCWPLLRERFGVARPAATMICAGLLDPRMRIEIEVTARRRSSDAVAAVSPGARAPVDAAAPSPAAAAVAALRACVARAAGVPVRIGRPTAVEPGLTLWPWRLEEDASLRNAPLLSAAGDRPEAAPALHVHVLLLAGDGPTLDDLVRLDLARRAVHDSPVLPVGAVEVLLQPHPLSAELLAMLFQSAGLPIAPCLSLVLQGIR